MKILIVSDTHRKDGNLYDVIEKEKPLDMLIHLGDAEGSEHVIVDWLNEGCELVMVQGNNDFFSSLDREIELDLGPHRAFLTHGHYYNVALDVDRLWEEAKDRGCDIAMFGHTHRPYLEEREGITLLNPGSLSYPRQEGRMPSYMIMDLEEDGTTKYHMMFLGD